MPAPPIYLDYSASTPVDPQVLAAMTPYLTEHFGNPSSLHRWGRSARKAVEAARQRVAELLHATPSEIFFTGSGSEANNLAVIGWAYAQEHKGRHIITSAIEHSAVLNLCRSLELRGWEVTYLPVDAEGFVSPDALAAAIRPDTVLASIMHGNNEIGTLQDLHAIGELLRERGVLFHTDAVQTAGKVPIDLAALPVDALTLSGHKLYGPKGIGTLFLREGTPRPEPLVYGGGQEAGLRSGTENIAAIVGLAKALEMSLETLDAEAVRLRGLQRHFIGVVEQAVPAAVLNGPRDLSRRIPGHVNFSFPPAEGESLVLHFDLKGVGVSSGSACHSASIEPSHVVMALGKGREIGLGTVRFSMGRPTTAEEVDRVLSVLPEIVNRLMKAAVSAGATSPSAGAKISQG